MGRFWRQGLLVASMIVYAVACIVIVALASEPVLSPAGSGIPDLVELRAASFSHRSSGEFTRDGRQVTAPLVTVTIPDTLAVLAVDDDLSFVVPACATDAGMTPEQ